ncbi:MAG: hypothetical protein WC861_00540 [Candidatus Micrarchaeia archaeon]|jgi:hypothetical protein
MLLFQIQLALEPQLKAQLASFNLEYLILGKDPKRNLQNVPEILKLVNGDFGQNILAGLALLRLDGKKDDAIREMAIAAFTKFSTVRNDFLSKYNELRKKYGINSQMSEIDIVGEAFAYSMGKNKIRYLEETNSAQGMAGNHLDCDLSSYMFMQLGKEVGLSLTAVTLPSPGLSSGLLFGNAKPAGHVVVAYGKGKITHYVETTLAMYDESMKTNNTKINDLLTNYKDLLQKFQSLKNLPADKVSQQNKSIADLKSGIKVLERMKSNSCVYPSGLWEQTNSDYSLNPGAPRMTVRLWDLSYLQTIMKRTLELFQNPKLAKDNVKYSKFHDEAKKCWEINKNNNQTCMEALRLYYNVLSIGVAAKVASRTEMTSLYIEGVRLFGEKKLTAAGIAKPGSF